MAKPAFLFDNRLADGLLTANSTASGFDVANLIDWSIDTAWKPTAAGAIVKVDLAGDLKHDFPADQQGWATVGATLLWSGGVIEITSTSTDPILNSPSNLSINGRVDRYIVARIERTAGSGWDGKSFYQNGAHGAAAAFQGIATDPSAGQLGRGYLLAVWDMHALVLGGDDWKEGITTQIRLDLGSTASDVFNIEWVVTLPELAADYCLVWGHDMATQGIEFKIRGSDDDFATDTLLATVIPTSNKPFVETFTSGQFRHFGFNFLNGVPTINIIAIGELLELPASLASGFDPMTRRPKGRLSTSVAGHPLARAIDYEEWRQVLSFPLVSWDWLRDTFEPAWIKHLGGNPFVFAWDRVGKPTELNLVSVVDGFDGPHRAGQIADLSLEVVGLAR